MSNFQRNAVHPETQELELADWLDDYFGRHVYGVRFADGKVFSEDEVMEAAVDLLVSEAQELGCYDET